ncbi:helix-turn-helix domain-containing protein [Cochlodiniinecator piscidefendens]|uniref:helix-turn-helix domain-containing protein n=1 Tax=Cochlodiniinecator piscidefendens TaxID=2715756 RepID=UPI00140726FA|nr:helix-turn-helix transcriptional regulator [Cochlodiniinecator piscidefendens]
MTDAENDWFGAEISTFGDRVAGARDALGMSQEELSRRLGVKLKTIHAWEGDLSEPRANKVVRLAGLLGVSMTWLINGEGDGIANAHEELPQGDDIRSILLEIREMQLEMTQTAARLGRMEKRLRTALHSVENDINA